MINWKNVHPSFLATSADTFFLEEELLKMKRLSVFFVFIFLVSILSVNYYYLENSIFQDDSLIFDTVDHNLDFSTFEIYQVLLNKRFISIIKISNNLFMPRISTCKFFTRAPPK
jgi:hypothetical protein